MIQYVKFLRGLQSDYNALTSKDTNTLYFVTEAIDSKLGKLYLGDIEITGNSSSSDGSGILPSQISLGDLANIDLSETIGSNEVLAYNSESGHWENHAIADLIDIPTPVVMIGASEDAAGSAGYVPAPQPGDNLKFLRGDGQWVEISIPEATIPEVNILNGTIVISEDDEGNEIRETQEEALTRISENIELLKGDIAIIKELIAIDTLGEEKYQYTAYVYDGSNWTAMDGNYNAKNVYFDQDFIFTKAIGTVSIPTSGSKTVEAEGKNLYEFFASIFAKEEYPSTPSTSASITSTNIGAKEVGTNIEVAYAFSTSANAYKYGPANGVQWSNCSATFNGETKTTASGTFTSVQVTDDTSLKITGSVSQSAGAIPKTNLGNDYPTAQIKAKEWTGLEKGTLTGYRAWFCGYKNGDNALTDATAITGAQVRALGNAANGSWLSQMEVNKMKQMFFAAPAGKGYKPSVKDHSTTAPQTVLGPITVYVPGANNYMSEAETANGGMAYDVWYVSNADAAGGSATLDIAKA